MESFEYHFLGLNKSFGAKRIIQDARIKVRNGQCTLLIGKNGAGKTTLLKIMSGLDKPDAGSFRMGSTDMKWGQGKTVMLKKIMYLHQQPYMFDGSVEKNLLFALNSRKPTRHIIRDAIEWAGLENIIEHDAKSLSGGEKQRVAIARAYVRNPQVVLLDEPTANLDQASKLKTLELLKQFKQQGIAMVIASHDPELFLGLQDERLQLDNSKLTNLKPRNKKDRNRVTSIHKYKAKSA